jgi:hypothetical protein
MLKERPLMRRTCGLVPALLALAFAGCALAAELNDYPTATRADYVYACMKANGETRAVLDHCSCSIDVVASILPYDRYVTAETAPCSVPPRNQRRQWRNYVARRRKPR